MRTLALIALVIAALACGADAPPSCGAPGLVRACACVGGAAGAQECSPGGAWSVCVCPDGGATEAGADAEGDAPTPPDAPAPDALDGAGPGPDAAVCAPGFADCDGDAANGCEADLRANTSHCGRCDGACAVGVNASSTCAAGTCALTCATGFADCDGRPGCETDVTTVLNCGRCGGSCPSGGGFRCCPRSETNRCPRADQPCA